VRSGEAALGTTGPPPAAQSAADTGGLGAGAPCDAATAHWVHSVPEDAELPTAPSTVRSPRSQLSHSSEFAELQQRLASLSAATQAAAAEAVAERSLAEAEAAAAVRASSRSRLVKMPASILRGWTLRSRRSQRVPSLTMDRYGA
jgi:hypothetical protein